ncbi:MAG: complex I subunit 4 family protein [Candidatus Micrarchaeia archaeon]
MNILAAMLVLPIAFLLAEIALSKKYSLALAAISTFVMLLGAAYLLLEGFIHGSILIAKSYTYIAVPSISISLYLSVASLMLLLMASVVLFVVSISGNISADKPKLSAALVLLFQVAATGLFTAGSLLMFFIFWDIGVVTAFFMINTLGTASGKKASITFLIYEIFASAMFLFAILLIYFYTPLHTFNIQAIIAGSGSIPAAAQGLIFFFMLLAFMVNMPLFPFHSWLPGAYAEASTQGSMAIAGILSKFGAFGLLIMFEILPIASHYSAYVAGIAIVSSIYAALVMMAQADIKRIIAYAAMVEMGIITLGISAYNVFGTYGALYGMLAQGATIALMFLVAGAIVHEFGERDIRLLKGIVASAKASAYSLVTGVFALSGLPLTAGFVADILIFIGAYKSFSLYGLAPLLAIIFMVSYMYYMLNKSVLSSRSRSENVAYIGSSQKIGYGILIAFIFLFGVLPIALLSMVH